jgi:hypothetical protein
VLIASALLAHGGERVSFPCPQSSAKQCGSQVSHNPLFVPFALIERSCEENGLAAAHGVHLINRGLPSLFGILRVMPGLLITVENIARQ